MKKTIADFEHPFDALEEFEQLLSKFTGAKGVVLTDSCTHAIELGIRYSRPSMYSSLPSHTYLSLPMTLGKLGIDFIYDDKEWDTRYKIGGTFVWDCAREFKEGMYDDDVHGHILCLSFGYGKPLSIGHGGAILTSDRRAYEYFKEAAYDGRNLKNRPWEKQKAFNLGFHYGMKPEDAVIGINKLNAGDFAPIAGPGHAQYPDLSELDIDFDSEKNRE